MQSPQTKLCWWWNGPVGVASQGVRIPHGLARPTWFESKATGVKFMLVATLGGKRPLVRLTTHSFPVGAVSVRDWYLIRPASNPIPKGELMQQQKQKDEFTVTGSEGTCPNCHRHIMLCPCHVVPGPKGTVRILDKVQYKEWKQQRRVTKCSS